MARQDPVLVGFNRGEISPQLLARTDLEHLRLAAQTQENWQPRVLGPMTLRPGSEMIGQPLGNQIVYGIPFVAQFNDTAILELTNNAMRVWVGGTDLVVRNSVSTFVPPFSSGAWAARMQTGSGLFSVNSDGLAVWNISPYSVVAINTELSIASQDVGVEHALRIVVVDGPIIFRIGSTPGADDLFIDQTLDTGTYSLAFTPTGRTCYVEFCSTIDPNSSNTVTNSQTSCYRSVVVRSIALDVAGPLALPTPWPENLLAAPATVRHDQSADVVFVAAQGVPAYEIVRSGVTSWGIQLYRPAKGPMNAIVGDASVLMSVDAMVGNTYLRCNQPIFSPSDVGTLFRLFHWGQNLSQPIFEENTWTDPIRVTGVSLISITEGTTVVDLPQVDRTFGVTISGNWSGAVINLERSFTDGTSDFNKYYFYPSNVSNAAQDDQLNNEIVYYRLGTPDPIQGTAVCSLSYGGGGWPGVCRVTEYLDPQTLAIEVLVPFSNVGNAFDWHQSEWSASEGFPTSVGLHEGRLWWAGSDRWWGSESDNYNNFDFDAVGDAQYIDEDIGQGPIQNINWLLSLDSLLGGADTQIIVARSDAIQSPLTPTNFNLRFSTTQGTAPIQAVKIDNRAIFINQSRRRIYLAVYDLYTYNYRAIELSNLNPDIAGFVTPPGGYVSMAMQRNPDTIIHAIRADGQLVELLYDADDDVKAYWRRTTPGGSYEQVMILPGEIEDQVFVYVNRGGTRYLERFARLDECWGDSVCKLVDCHTVYQGAPTKQISAPWLAGQAVAVWADGIDAGLETWLAANPTPEGQAPPTPPTIATVQLDANGNGTLAFPHQNITFGLPYKAAFLSTKLAYAAQKGSAVNQVKRVDHLGFVLWNTHYQGVRYGAYRLNPMRGSGDFSADFSPDFNTALNALWDSGTPLDNLPLVEKGVVIPANFIWGFYDNVQMELAGDADTDSRLYFEAASPRPATICGATFSIDSNG